MITNSNTAKKLSEVMLDIADELHKSIVIAKQRCSPEEYKAYSLAVGRVLWNLSTQVLDPLFAKHPILKPPSYD
jgi:hypothetical protein